MTVNFQKVWSTVDSLIVLLKKESWKFQNICYIPTLLNESGSDLHVGDVYKVFQEKYIENIEKVLKRKFRLHP